jgi:Xaa-Pro aminopeptidase
VKTEARILNRIPDAELERRWAQVRRYMAEADIDAILMQANNDWLGGAVKWFTDIPATNGYPRTVVFPREGRMTVIEMGAFGTDRRLAQDEGLHRGVGRFLGTPSFSAVGYTQMYDADLTVEALSGVSRLGLILPGAAPHAFVTRIQERLGPGVDIVDVTEAIDALKAVKSVDEIDAIRRTCALQDEVFARVCDEMRPGMRDIDLSAFAQAQALKLGSEQGIFLGASAPVGVRSPFLSRWAQGRELKAGDHLSLLIEVNGAGGFYAEIARTLVLGRASTPLKDAFAHVKGAQDHTLSLIRPGARPAEIAAAHDAYMRARGLPPELRLYAHGQGYDMVERPLIRADETMPLAQGMCLAVHPGYETADLFAVICDNYLVQADGPSPCLHRTEKRLFELKG